MISMTDVIRAVAEAKCPHLPHDSGWTDGEYRERGCRTCQGAGLRWPTLSREESNRFGSRRWGFPSGRIPDVTLEKVLEELNSIEGEVVVGKGGNGPGMNNNHWGYYVRVGDDPPIMYEAKTQLEALCAALLATEE